MELDTAALLEAAARAGAEISDRMLETFRAQGLIPRPHRAGYVGRTPQWRYPPGTDRQLVALLRWRQHSKDPDLLKILLWLDGFAVPVTNVRDALTRQLRAITALMEREISQQARRLGLNPADQDARSQAIGVMAQTLAGKRGSTPLPRRSRVPAEDRTRAVALLIRVFGLGETIEGTAEDATAVERTLGIANGRRQRIDGAGPWLTGPAEDLFGAATITGLPRLLDAAANASDAELTSARHTVIAIFQHMPLMARMLGAVSGEDNYAGFAAFAQLDQHPEVVVYIVPMVVAMQRAGWNENLEAVTSALRPLPELAAQAERILAMPASTVEGNLAGKPADVQKRASRLIEAAIDGTLDVSTSE